MDNKLLTIEKTPRQSKLVKILALVVSHKSVLYVQKCDIEYDKISVATGQIRCQQNIAPRAGPGTSHGARASHRR